MFAPEHRRGIIAWLLPVTLATTNTSAVASALMDELRRQRIVAPGPSVIERLTGAVMLQAERHVALQLTRGLTAEQTTALDALLDRREGMPMSVLAWARQPPGAPGQRALARLVERLDALRTLDLDPVCADGVHPERLRKLAREGARLAAQHLRALSPLRRRAALVATVLDATTRLTDEGVGLFDRAVGRMFRRAEVREQNALLRDARAINDKVRLLAKLGGALIMARDAKADLETAVAEAVGWDRLARGVTEAERIARSDKADLAARAARAWPVLHRLGPLFLGAFRLRAGDIWIEGSRRWRAVEDQLISPTPFAAMRAAGALPLAVPTTAEAYLAERRALLSRRLVEIAAKAAADCLEEVRIRDGELRVSSLKAARPDEAEPLAERLYGMLPNARITALPADDTRVVLTAVLADATNLGLTRMADARAVHRGRRR